MFKQSFYFIDPLSLPDLEEGDWIVAYKDNILVAGSYHGFNIYELNDNGIPSLISSVVCPGGQGDVSIVNDALLPLVPIISEPSALIPKLVLPPVRKPPAPPI